ncbi:glycoside hydrolase family 38 N-terminal domain-containing protein [Rathayibacter soli]|uniref:glycoside hydrolase family 38 N-terminal domain-containing protein n=1 Tax=Rathayibacter soli TaxID=3144168 RepID=UPI0027E42FF3|nr:glycoside hydrolase family 38 C-terminal domain-containing protein [Glaciibacter superstes]
MSVRKLIKTRPWDDQDARLGLIERAICAEATVGSTGVAILLEPLMKTVNGVRVQSVRMIGRDVELAGRALRPSLTTSDGSELVVAVEDGPAGSLRLLVRTVDEPVQVSLAVPEVGAERIEFLLENQREWTIHLVHHSHFDFGYTDRQTEVFAAQRSYLDSALDLIEETEQWPEEARFRWNSEALWAISDWQAHRPENQMDRLVRHVKAGSIGLSALPYNLHTDVCSTDELHELLRGARRLRDEYGIPFASAMQTDVPGQVAGLPDALQEVGVKYLSVAHNWAGRSQPHTTGALNLPRLFRWRSLAGNEVLVWMTDSPHGLAYMEGPMVGFTEGIEQVENYFPAYLTAMATKGYPFPPGVFGAHGESLDGRDPYPWDILHLRVQGFMGDNAPARLALPSIVRQWNDTWDSPRLRVSRNEDFFEDAEARLGDELITVEGDWGDWWVEGVGSAAVPMAFMRKAQAEVVEGRTISQLSALSGGQAVRDEATRSSETYDAISMFNEHTWGAGNSWTHGDEGFSSGELQWQWKVAQSLVAQQRSSELLETALAYLGQMVATAPDAAASFVIANPTSLRRSGVVRFLLPEAAVPFSTEIELVDGRDGSRVPFVLEQQSNAAHRESGRWVEARLENVPALGSVRVDVLAAGGARAATATGHQQQAASRSASGSSEYGLISLGDSGRSEGSDTERMPRGELLTLENEYLTVRVDEHMSTIASIVEKRTGRELVNQDAVVGFNGYVYDEYASSGVGFNHLANKLAVSERLEMLATRTLARPSRVVDRTTTELEQTLVYEYQADGVNWVRVTLRLRHGEPRLLIENRLSKPSRLVKESAYFSFPFAGDAARMRFEVSGGVTGDGLPHIPGAPQHMRGIRDWVLVENEDNAVAWVTRDAPLVEPHAIAVPYAPFPASTSPSEPGTVYSWVHNNVWDTNFPIEQGFEATFGYAVGVREGSDESPSELALRTAAALVHPLRAARATGTDTDGPAEQSALTISDPRVQVVGLAQADDGAMIVRLQSFADEPVQVELRFGRELLRAAASTYLGDELADLVVSGNSASLQLRRFEAAAVKAVVKTP